jgi:hypothetical protein
VEVVAARPVPVPRKHLGAARLAKALQAAPVTTAPPQRCDLAVAAVVLARQAALVS